MKFSNLAWQPHKTQLILLLFSLFYIGLNAQQPAPVVKISNTPNALNEYTFYTLGLNTQDLVFYRFSDGYEMSRVQSSFNSTASVKRVITSNDPNISVSAYVARKGGPSNIVISTATMETVNAFGTLPHVLSEGEYTRIKGSSWRPFVDPAEPEMLTDDKTTPFFLTPTKPWFFLSVALKSPIEGNAYAEITIPAGAKVVGVILKNQWIPFTSPNPTFNPDPHVSSLSNSPDKVGVGFNNASNGQEFNLYLVLETSTKVGDNLFFTSSVNDITNHKQYSSHSLALTTVKNPHDPNLLTPFQDNICPGSSAEQELRYRVDFQNLGVGIASNVSVKITFDPKIVANPNPTQIETSPNHNITSSTSTKTTLTFNFDGINLPGIDQYPHDKTMGWVEFTVHTLPCITTSSHINVNTPTIDVMSQELYEAMGEVFPTTAAITFANPATNFSETIQTNMTVQHLRKNCGEPDPECIGTKIREQPESSNKPLELVAFTPLCFPSPVEDRLDVQIPSLGYNGPLNIVIRDLNGIEHLSKMFNISAGEEFQCSLDTKDLTPGMYLIYITQGTEQFVKKIIKI